MIMERRMIIALVALAAGLYYRTNSSQSSAEAPVLATENGLVKGIVSYSRGGRQYYEYLGIPYAKPPVGELRFEAPEPPDNWEGVRDASSYGSQCIQIELLLGLILGDEDCLFLNVYTPKVTTKGKKLPVMVYIHGGLFVNGGTDMWRPSYFMDEDVILVSMNYRLAALGFLNTGDGVVRGNMALKDQVFAFKWIQNNIENFGGDKNSVTIFGESAGGISSHFHMLSPLSRGLFHRVISQSGMALHFWTMNTNNEREQAVRLGSKLGCPTHDIKTMVACMKKADASQIVDIHRETMDPLRDHVTLFKPTVEPIDDEKAFMAKHPLVMIKDGNFTRVPWIAGVNSEEGLIIGAAVMANQTLQDMADNDWSDFIQKLLVFTKNDEIAQKIRDFYFGDCAQKCKESFTENLTRYTRMISDRGFFVDFHLGAQLHTSFTPVYLYYYSYPGEWSVANLFMEVRGTLPRLMEAGWAIISHWVKKSIFGRSLPHYGASHSDELALLFEMPWISDVPLNSRDYHMSADLVQLWVSFASEKHPLRFRNATWYPSVGNRTLQYLQIDANPKMIDEPFTDRVKFWNSLNIRNYY